MPFDGEYIQLKPTFAEPPYEHLTVETAALLNAPVSQRIAYLHRDYFLPYPQGNRALYLMQKRFDAPDSTRARGLVIYADSGMGKTHVQVEFFRRNQIDPKTKQRLNGGEPILYVTLAAAESIKTALMRFFDALGLPIPAKFDDIRARSEILRMIKLCNYIVILIEEAQDLCTIPQLELESFAKFLKLLSNESGRPFIICGTPNMKTLIHAHDQFRERMDTMTFKPWIDIELTRTFIWGILSQIALPKASPITDDTSVGEILQTTKGGTEKIAEAINKAGERAIETNRENFDMKFLKKNGF